MFFVLLVISVVVTFIATDTLVNKKVKSASSADELVMMLTPQDLFSVYYEATHAYEKVLQELCVEASYNDFKWGHNFYKGRMDFITRSKGHDYHVVADTEKHKYY